MRVQCFIPNWPGPKQHARETADLVSEYCPVTILNDPDDYFNAQWAKAREKFTDVTQGHSGDILFWIMADVTPPKNFCLMFSEMIRLFKRGDIGWYAPDIAWTSYIYNLEDLRPVEPGIYEVPNTDSLCFGIRSDVINLMPHIDPELCFMWGMDFTAAAAARLLGLKIVRDYRFKAEHPNSTGYDIQKASTSMAKLFGTYPEAFCREIDTLLFQTSRLRSRAKQ